MRNNNTRKKLGSYPSVGVVFSITLALFVTGLFGLLIIYSQELERLVRENIKLEVYLKNGLTETQRLQIERKLESLPYINKSPGIDSSIKFISKDEAARKLIAETGEDFTKFFDENPLHEAYVLKIDPAFHTDSLMNGIKHTVEKMNGVREVSYVQNLLASVNKNTTAIGLILSIIEILLLITVILMINSSLRLALFSQRFLIRSMQLVGARKGFILRPFLLRALFHGILSGILASAGVWLFVNYTNRLIEDLTAIQNKDRMVTLSICLVIVGMIVAVTSSYFAIRKYLRMSLDELY